MLKNESIPIDCPYWYKKVSVFGMAIKKEKKIPRMKRKIKPRLNQV